MRASVGRDEETRSRGRAVDAPAAAAGGATAGEAALVAKSRARCSTLFRC